MCGRPEGFDDHGAADLHHIREVGDTLPVVVTCADGDRCGPVGVH